MKLRKVTEGQVTVLRSADQRAKEAIFDLRLAGAKKAADAVARARKSIGGAIRHAERCLFEQSQS